MTKYKNIFITGASRGMGYEIAKYYMQQECNLFLIARNTEKLEQLSKLSNDKTRIYYCKCDVSDKIALHSAIDNAVKQMGRIDLAILNAGIGIPDWFNNYSTDNLLNIFGVNFFGVAYGLEKLIPIMKQQGGGTIAGTSSLADSRGYTGSSSYCTSKAAVSNLLESARIELKKTPVRIVTIKPGFVDTDMVSTNRFKMPFLLTPEKAARIITKRLERDCSRIYFPLPTVFLTYFVKIIPGWLYEMMMNQRKTD
jgi:short-subunit dehydrogenase